MTAERSWTFLTNHAHVLIAISRDPELRERDISRLVGVTEGAVQRILHELEEAGYIRSEKIGRRKRYEVITDGPMRHAKNGDDRNVDDGLSVLDGFVVEFILKAQQ